MKTCFGCTIGCEPACGGGVGPTWYCCEFGLVEVVIGICLAERITEWIGSCAHVVCVGGAEIFIDRGVIIDIIIFRVAICGWTWECFDLKCLAHRAMEFECGICAGLDRDYAIDLLANEGRLNIV